MVNIDSVAHIKRDKRKLIIIIITISIIMIIVLYLNLFHFKLVAVRKFHLKPENSQPTSIIMNDFRSAS